VVAAAVRAIVEARGALRIRELARRLAISQDPLEKRFRRAVGMSPKQLARLVRIRHAIAAYRPGMSLARLAIAAGFYDQAHFHRELRAVTGEAPGRFLPAAMER
jgi:methylphosphotriester-DNA--protein-cysteine methyltransferase